MKTNELHYELPAHLIAQEGLTDRAGSRLLVLDRSSSGTAHRHFRDLPEYLREGDCLVINDSKVLPARFYIRRESGGRIEGLFLKLSGERIWEVLMKGASRLKEGESVALADPFAAYAAIEELRFRVEENCGAGQWRLRAEFAEEAPAVLERHGITPLPPYIRRGKALEREPVDRQRYQTVYAERSGSVAAPTAGLHFTEELLTELKGMGVQVARVLLHVGLGTFQAIGTERVEDHRMHAEYFELDEDTAGMINGARERGGRVIAVGTTSVRALEAQSEGGRVKAGSGWTDIFITPGHCFQTVDGLVTNFHLPGTTLLALVCALAGTERTLAAYREAVRREYRFYSYGDAMLIL